MDNRDILLDVRHLRHVFPLGRREFIRAVDDVSFQIRRGEVFGLVGESGSGKSTVARCIMNLYRPTGGEIYYQGFNICDPAARRASRRMLQTTRQMIFQDSGSSLDQWMRVCDLIAEPLRIHRITPPRGTCRAEAAFQMHYVGLDERYLDAYPPELSGGQRQRVLIAMALTRDPKLVIADEPTTALDVTVQKQVIDLLNKLQHELGFAMVFVSHDLALVAEVANSITVMYAGQVVEQGPVKEILTNPIHEYTRGLLGSVLSIEAGGARLHQVPGSVPSPKDFPEGDRFRPRSSHPDKTSNVRPMLKRVANSDHYYAELPDSELKRIGVKPYLTGGAN